MAKSRYSSAHFLSIATSAPSWQGYESGHHERPASSRSTRFNHRKQSRTLSKSSDDYQAAIDLVHVKVRDFGASSEPTALASGDDSTTNLINPTIHEAGLSKVVEVTRNDCIATNGTSTLLSRDEDEMSEDSFKSAENGTPLEAEAKELSPAPAKSAQESSDPKATSVVAPHQDTPSAIQLSIQRKIPSPSARRKQQSIAHSGPPIEIIRVKQARKHERRRTAVRLTDVSDQTDAVDPRKHSIKNEASVHSLYHSFMKETSQPELPRKNPRRFRQKDVRNELLDKSEQETPLELLLAGDDITRTGREISNNPRRKRAKSFPPHSRSNDYEDGESYGSISRPHINNTQTLRNKPSGSIHRPRTSDDRHLDTNDIYPQSAFYNAYFPLTPPLTPATQNFSRPSTAATLAPTSPTAAVAVPLRESSLKAIEMSNDEAIETSSKKTPKSINILSKMPPKPWTDIQTQSPISELLDFYKKSPHDNSFIVGDSRRYHEYRPAESVGEGESAWSETQDPHSSLPTSFSEDEAAAALSGSDPYPSTSINTTTSKETHLIGTNLNYVQPQERAADPTSKVNPQDIPGSEPVASQEPTTPELDLDLDALEAEMITTIPMARSRPVPRFLEPAPWLVDEDEDDLDGDAIVSEPSSAKDSGNGMGAGLETGLGKMAKGIRGVKGAGVREGWKRVVRRT